MNLTMVPMWVLSGVFFSSSNFPAAVQPFIQALPLTALIDALRAVMLEGATLGAIRGELATLAMWTDRALRDRAPYLQMALACH